MNRIDHTFHRLRDEGRKGFVAYITAGDPTLERTAAFVLELERAGADVIELGVPFSDPLADGVVNQRAAERALRHGVSLKDILALVRRFRNDTQVPIVLFTYINPVLRFGVKEFVIRAREAGVDGVLALDYPPEEASAYKELMDSVGLATVSLIAPTSTDERIRSGVEFATGFVYYVSRTGVTGARESVEASVRPMVQKVKALTTKPVAVGFGISTPEHVDEVARYADAVVVGSAIVQVIEKHGASEDGVRAVGDFVRSLVRPLRKR